MMQIASGGTIDDESLIAYIIAGIGDDAQNKAVLYGARTLDELKSKIKAYETMKACQKTCSSQKRSQDRGHHSVSKAQQNSKRCYNCGPNIS